MYIVMYFALQIWFETGLPWSKYLVPVFCPRNFLSSIPFVMTIKVRVSFFFFFWDKFDFFRIKSLIIMSAVLLSWDAFALE